ncbi:polyprenyl synthetase family protein [Natrialba swarupiae]|uniref:Polyprenyl synthetase n=1 Tax=Natrialba swarupiae TaxID=2448032 RepID=A0A5D5AGU5_9EURY|nr:hypothetical protein [Natrialba swarupiae]TYT60344.1 hypothetical protein FYC77_19340 [Natrialba swarupiae]
MSDYTTIHDRPDHDGRSFRDLPPSVRAIVADSLPTRDRCLSVALCTLAGEVARSFDGDRVDDRGDYALGPVSEAVCAFDGYVSIRFALLVDDRYETANDRDAAILASDYLHASAYTAIGKTPISDRRALELYRTLVDGSTAIATGFFSLNPEIEAPATSRSDASRHPDVSLAETAAALGTTAVGATAETRSAIERYARSLTEALTATPSVRDEVRTAVVRTLSGSTDRWRADGSDDRNDVGHPDGTQPPMIDHLETARTAIESLRRGRDESAGSHERRDPIDRLERATRIPFEHVADVDG